MNEGNQNWAKYVLLLVILVCCPLSACTRFSSSPNQYTSEQVPPGHGRVVFGKSDFVGQYAQSKGERWTTVMIGMQKDTHVNTYCSEQVNCPEL